MKLTETSTDALPQSLLTKLYDCTGSQSGGNQGFFLYYINDVGEPSAVVKTENACVDMALSKLMELSLKENIK